MCIKLKGSGMSPGQIMAFMTKLGKASGIWGFGNGAQYNARVESLETSWRKIKDNRGVILVDSFWEKGKQFTRSDGKLFNIGVIYNEHTEFAVVTMPSNETVKPYHHRMPLILADEEVEQWLQARQSVVLPLSQDEFVLRAA